MSSFFWGYVATHVLGGLLADRLGGKCPLALAVFVSALCTLLTPMVTVTCGWGCLVVIRIVMGLAQVCAHPMLVWPYILSEYSCVFKCKTLSLFSLNHYYYNITGSKDHYSGERTNSLGRIDKALHFQSYYS